LSCVVYHLLAEPVATCAEMLHARSGSQRLGHLDASLVVLKQGRVMRALKQEAPQPETTHDVVAMQAAHSSITGLLVAALSPKGGRAAGTTGPDSNEFGTCETRSNWARTGSVEQDTSGGDTERTTQGAEIHCAAG
jgi:hypothetical protein